jgi:hypothetical protein
MAELARARLAEAQSNSDVKDFSDALPPAPPVNGTSDFRVGDASCRLRAIAGYAGCGSEAAAGGVPKLDPKVPGPGSRIGPNTDYRTLSAEALASLRTANEGTERRNVCEDTVVEKYAGADK